MVFDSIAEIPCSDWGSKNRIKTRSNVFDEKFSKAALETLCDAYPGAATAVILGYNKAMLEGKAKN